MASDPKMLRATLESARPDLPLTFKAMFGGIMAYADGKPIVSLSDVGLAIKLAAADQDELLKVKGAKRLQYEPDAPVSKRYLVVPAALLKDRAELRAWVLRAIAGAKTAPRKKKVPSRAKSSSR